MKTAYAFVACGVGGMRIGETLAGRRSRITLPERKIRIDGQITDLKGKGPTLTTVKNEQSRANDAPAMTQP